MTEWTPTAEASPISRRPFGAAAPSYGIPAAKLEPPRAGRRRTVRRARLLESLSAAVHSRRLTLVAAPPGSGKTTLLSSWIDDGAAPARTAWLTLDEEDNEPERFWHGVLVALEPTGADPPRPLASPRLPGELTALLERAIGDGGGDGPVVLVLDDFQEVTDERVLAGVAQLLKVAPPCFRMVIASRCDPELPLHRLRLAAQLAELRAVPLAFTREEAQLLVTSHGVMLSGAEVDSLLMRTEGWAGALALASLALGESDDPSLVVRDFGGDDRAVSDYLANEVLAALPERLCDFLVRTSIADEVCGELADAMLGEQGGAEALAELERRNCFVIALDSRRRWYRYHRLLLELLRSRLAARPRGECEALHTRAARWHAANDRPAEAIRHAISAQQWGFAADLAGERWLDVVLAGRGAALRPLLSRLPDELVEREPAIAVAFAAIQLEPGGSTERCDTYLAAARAELALGASDADVPELHALVTLQRARSRGERAPGEGLAIRSPERRAFALVLLGSCEMLWIGERAAAARHLRTGIALARQAEQDYIVLGGLAQLAALRAAEGSLRTAVDLALEARALAEAHHWLDLPHAAPALLALGWAELLWCDPAAPVTLARAGAASRTASDLPVRLQIAALSALTKLESSDGARRALETLRGHVDALGDWQAPDAVEQLLRGVEARLLIATGEVGEAIEVAAGLPACATRGVVEARAALVQADPAAAIDALRVYTTRDVAQSDLATRLEVLVLDAVARHAQLDHAGAAASLERALELAGAERFPWVFLQAGAPLRDLLARQVRQGTRHRGPVEELQVLLDRRAPGPQLNHSMPLLEPLSKRELTVLGYLETMLSTEEIAAELFLSTNTVKTHTKSIYRKLGVARRRHAISQARALRLL